jgi:hypothetical protein
MAKTVPLDSPRCNAIAFCAYTLDLVGALAAARRDDEPTYGIELQLEWAARGLAVSFAELVEGRWSRTHTED